MIRKESIIEGMDAEWLELIFEAREMGIAQETIQEFLNQNRITKIFFEK